MGRRIRRKCRNVYKPVFQRTELYEISNLFSVSGDLVVYSTNSYWSIKFLEWLKFLLVIWSHPFVGIYFVNKGTNSMSFEMVRSKKIYCQNIFGR